MALLLFALLNACGGAPSRPDKKPDKPKGRSKVQSADPERVWLVETYDSLLQQLVDSLPDWETVAQAEFAAPLPHQHNPADTGAFFFPMVNLRALSALFPGTRAGE